MRRYLHNIAFVEEQGNKVFHKIRFTAEFLRGIDYFSGTDALRYLDLISTLQFI